MDLKKSKVFRDPIHRYITVNKKIIWDLVKSRAFQRLNNIKQLGGTYQIFHGAVHTRFGHSLGTYHIVSEIIHTTNITQYINNKEQISLLVAALLHDIGHGPLSHASEMFLCINHEEVTKKILLEDQEISTILKNHNILYNVLNILNRKENKKFLCDIICGDIDSDRMDYLLRDSYYSGVSYGYYDKERLLRVMYFTDKNLAFKKGGLYAIENFILSRYHMHKQVYNNYKCLSFERLLYLSIIRFKYLYINNKIKKKNLYDMFYKFLVFDKDSDIDFFLNFDDNLFFSMQHLFINEEDDVLSSIALLIISRKLPKVKKIEFNLYDNLFKYVEKQRTNGIPESYLVDVFADGKTSKNRKKCNILIGDECNLTEVTQMSKIIKSITSETDSVDGYLIFIDKDKVKKNIGFYKKLTKYINE